MKFPKIINVFLDFLCHLFNHLFFFSLNFFLGCLIFASLPVPCITFSVTWMWCGCSSRSLRHLRRRSTHVCYLCVLQLSWMLVVSKGCVRLVDRKSRRTHESARCTFLISKPVLPFQRVDVFVLLQQRSSTSELQHQWTAAFCFRVVTCCCCAENPGTFHL